MKLKQLTIEIENSPGRLYNITKMLGDEGINLRALNLVDKENFGLLRLLVSDIKAARKLMMEKQIPAIVEDVVAVEINDKPGELSRLLAPMRDELISVQYMYAFAGTLPGKAVMIFRFSDNDAAAEIMKNIGAKLYDSKSFDLLESSN